MSDEMNRKKHNAADEHYPHCNSINNSGWYGFCAGWDAAVAEMEAENKRLRAALESLQCYCHLKNGYGRCSCCTAKEALKESK